jgi:tetratricopeptide (TPR) repeat protein
MTEALITELSKIRALKVISRTSAMRFKNGHRPAPQIARELGVDALIEGSVLRDGDQVRISVQLIDGGSDHHLWARSFDREMGGILALHSEVAQAIAAEIRITLTPQERTLLGSDRAVNPKAYERYVLGRHHWNRRRVEEYWLAVKNFKQALEHDPGYAPAQAALAEAYMLLGEQGAMPQSDARTLAGAAITKARELDPELAEVNTAWGVWKLHYAWDWNGSHQAFRRAIEINPGYSPAHQIFGRTLGFAGRFVEARREIEQARDIDPLSSVLRAYRGQIDIFEGRYDDAIEHLHQSLELDNRHPLVLHSLGEAYLAQGKFADAVTWLERSIDRTDEPSSHFIAMLGCSYARAGRTKDALAVLERLQRREEQEMVSAFDTAALHLALGDKERALGSLEKGCEHRDPWMVELTAWPWFDSIERDPRYDALLRKIGFPN